MADFIDTGGDIINLNYMVGEQSSSVRIMPMNETEAENIAAAQDVADILEAKVDADLMSVTARVGATSNSIRDDSAARLYPTRFNFVLVRTGGTPERQTLFVPWAITENQAGKKATGILLAAALSGANGTYTFRS